MKDKVLTLIIAMSLALTANVFFSSIANVETGIVIVKAAVIPDPFTIHSPSNRTYDTRFLTLDISFVVGMGGGKYSVPYYIDGKYLGTVPFTVEGTEEPHVTYPARGFLELPELSEGSHSLTVVLTWTGNVRGYPSNNETVYFTIDSNGDDPNPNPIVDSTAPNISNLSVRAGVYNSIDIPLSFTTDEAISKACYSLDGMDNVTINGNTTLTGLTSGEHSLMLYAEDEAGNIGAAESVLFTVEQEKKLQNPEPFPTALVITISGASLAVAGIVLLVYFKRRKR
jgi:hypothetical protein